MTLTELRYIIALDRTGHFGRAAESCFVSQPTLSVAIKKLEESLGVVLFERSKTRVGATPVGRRIIDQAQLVLDQVAIIEEMASSGKDQLATPLSLGAIFTIAPYLFPHFLPEIQGNARSMPIRIEESYTAVLRRKLREGQLDAIIIALPFTEPDVLTKVLYDEPFVVLMPPSHPLGKQDRIEPEQLLDENVLLLGDGHCFRDQVLEICPGLEHRLQEQGYQASAEGSSLETLKHMVASGMGVTVLPMSAAGTLPYDGQFLITRPFTDPVPMRSVALAWRTSFPRPQAIDVIYDAIRACNLAIH